MNRVELIEAISEKAGCSKKDAGNVLSAFIDAIQTALSKGDKVTLTGFGSWEARKRPARTGRNPQTGETMTIAAKTVPAFSAGKTFKTIVNEG